MEEKQKIRVHYGLREEQLRRFIRNSKKGAAANWVNKLIGLLERRLDNLVFRLGFAGSIRAARQLCSHGHILVDGKKVTVGSYVVPQGAKVSVAEKSRENQIVLQASRAPRLEVPDFLRKESESEAWCRPFPGQSMFRLPSTLVSSPSTTPLAKLNSKIEIVFERGPLAVLFFYRLSSTSMRTGEFLRASLMMICATFA